MTAMPKTDGFPRVRANKKFKKQAYRACKANNVTYAQAVRILMHKLIEEQIKINIDDGYDFEQSAKIVLESESAKKIIDSFMKSYDPNRTYPNAKKI